MQKHIINCGMKMIQLCQIYKTMALLVLSMVVIATLPYKQSVNVKWLPNVAADIWWNYGHIYAGAACLIPLGH